MLSSGRGQNLRQALAGEGPPPPLFAALLQGAAALRREKGVDFVSGGPQHAGRLGILTFEGLSEKKNRVPLPGRNLRLTNSLCQVSCTTLLALQHAGGFRFSMPPSQRIALPLSQQVAHKVFRVLPNVYLV